MSPFQEELSRQQQERGLGGSGILLTLVIVVGLTVVIGRGLWMASWLGNSSRGWDGTGHYAIAQIYDSSIFPDTFGWSNAYSGGMPFPNFYPPVFYWIVSLLHRTHLFSFANALKIVLILPVLLIPSRAWDGTGHDAIGQLYDQGIFPKTFGWINGYFGGMPFPNFYPPVFYWCVGLLHHSHLLSFNSSFKTVVSTPVLLLPVAVWFLVWFLADRDRLIAMLGAVAVVPLLVDVRITGSLLAGLDYFSTFQIGLYTQPLGFVLMIAWFIIYSGQSKPNDLRAIPIWRITFSSFLLALVVLSNFFNAITSVVFILGTLSSDLLCYRRAVSSQAKRTEKSIIVTHVLSPLIALSLTLFWVLPMLTEYQYFVTRPYTPETESLISPGLIAWYAIAVVGFVFWLSENVQKANHAAGGRLSDTREAGAAHLTRAAWPFLMTCLMLAASVVFAATVAPKWFPLQAPRFLATLTFLLTVPVGFALASAFRWTARLLGEMPRKGAAVTLRRARFTAAVFVIFFLILVGTAPSLGWTYAFYPKKGRSSIDDVLDFARQHQDGRYLVEVINPKVGPAWTEASFDARAINSYLGAQGNETISGVFHEASPNSLFTLPVVNAFSNYPDSFGVSSILADDLDFAAQPLSEHLKRAQFLGVKYLVIRTPAMKERVSREIPTAVKHDLGWWSVFELLDSPTPKVQALAFKPALVLSSFTLKARHRNEYSFVRLAEEQFADNWFDVVLVRSTESKIDRLSDLDKFSALIIDTYDWSNQEAAFERLREFAQTRPLILLSSESSLFHRIQTDRANFRSLEIVERQAEERGEIVDALKPSYHYNDSLIRKQWKSIRTILERHKIPTSVSPSAVTGEYGQKTISLDSKTANGDSVPVLIATTFHPNWLRNDGASVYAATPFYMLTFVDRPVLSWW